MGEDKWSEEERAFLSVVRLASKEAEKDVRTLLTLRDMGVCDVRMKDGRLAIFAATLDEKSWIKRRLLDLAVATMPQMLHVIWTTFVFGALVGGTLVAWLNP